MVRNELLSPAVDGMAAARIAEQRIEGRLSGVPKVLLLVNSPPWGSGTGEHYLRSLAGHLPQGALCRYSTIQGEARGGHEEWLGFPSIFSEFKFPALPVVSSLTYLRFRMGGLARLLSSILAFSERERPKLIWAVLSSPVMYLLAHRTAALLRIPLICSILDPPDYLIENLHLDPFVRKIVNEEFRLCMLASRRVAVMSEEMGKEYSRIYGAACTVIRSGVHPSLWAPERPMATDPKTLVIGFAGSLYAKNEWRALLRSFESVKGVLHGRKIKIKFVGHWPRLGVPRTPAVEYHKPVSPAEAIRLMSEVDLCYLPYWFDRRYARTAQLSFPSKLSAYVAAGRPVLYHGPTNSTPTQFLAKYEVGISCGSNDTAQLIRAIERCAWDRDFLRSYPAARFKALEEELGLEAVIRQFAMFLGVERSDLAAMHAVQ
jgi:glycosyltransferase involved in cell wall biosynthesis